MPGGSSSPSNSTTTTRAEPWRPAQDGLKLAIEDAQKLYQNGGFAQAPYQGQTVAGFGNTTQQGMDRIMQQAAGGTPGTDAALRNLTSMASGQNQYRDLDGVRNNILSSAIPAAAAQFSGSGLTNSSVAQQGVGQAASAALAPFEYDAYNQQQGRALQAAQMIPGLEAAQYRPGQIQMGIGGMQDALRQQQLNAQQQKWQQTQGQGLNNFNGYLQTIMGLGGMGSTQAQTAPGQQGGGGLGGGLLNGVGTWGALAGNPVTAPFAIGGGLLAGLGGLL